MFIDFDSLYEFSLISSFSVSIFIIDYVHDLIISQFVDLILSDSFSLYYMIIDFDSLYVQYS